MERVRQCAHRRDAYGGKIRSINLQIVESENVLYGQNCSMLNAFGFLVRYHEDSKMKHNHNRKSYQRELSESQ
jgi:hypothetical protein